MPGNHTDALLGEPGYAEEEMRTLKDPGAVV
jgi:hypothetical protein